jgi:hypothetical protein
LKMTMMMIMIKTRSRAGSQFIETVSSGGVYRGRQKAEHTKRRKLSSPGYAKLGRSMFAVEQDSRHTYDALKEKSLNMVHIDAISGWLIRDCGGIGIGKVDND